MTMNNKSAGALGSAAMAITLMLGLPVMAQDTAQTPGLELSTGEVIGAAGGEESYTGATHGDWELVCMRAEEGEDPCQMYQLLRDADGNATAEITMFPLPPGQEAVAGATILTPLETLLTAQLVMQVDQGAAKRYPFTFCTAIGCIARVGFTAAEVDAFRGGARATWQLVPVAAPDQTVDLNMSLIGFTAAFNDLSEALQ
ncbi:invasion associated locus B family protein [Roseinatronobacter sp.]|uniref:invasion associated locus B family protein n=1 Tax=Roseinatronobacter sp. TaxID=1945755 RepID=UPI0025D4E5B9|nr:invasion associated locus B family protein [Roseibaca sp.]